jgi:hypothetical protein
MTKNQKKLLVALDFLVFLKHEAQENKDVAWYKFHEASLKQNTDQAHLFLGRANAYMQVLYYLEEVEDAIHQA